MRIVLIGIALLLSWTVNAQSSEEFHDMLEGMYKKSVPLIKATQLSFESSRTDDILILDAREPEEYDISHIEGAVCVGYNDFDLSSLDSLTKDKDTKIIVYCSVGYRSERIGEKLQKEGYTYVYNLYGGIFDWVNNHYEVVNEQGEPTSVVHGYNKKWSQWVLCGEKVY